VRSPEEQEPNFPVFDETSSRDYEDYSEERLKYFRAKYDYYVFTTLD
jgi:hypothetical protein